MRILYILRNRGCRAEDRRDLIEALRAAGDVRNVRIASDHLEVEVWEQAPGSMAEILEKLVGRVIEIREIEEGSFDKNHEEAVRAFVRLFNAERFWEAHTVLEGVWRSSGDPVSRALIIAAAAFVKIQEGDPVRFEELARKALEIISSFKDVGRYHCIDLSSVARGLEASVVTGKPLKIACEETGSN